LVAGQVPVGAVVQVTTADTDDILGGTRAALMRATDRFPAGVKPQAALIFSCAVRRFLLGSRTRVEAEIARSILGPRLPMAGIYCNGEIGPVHGVETSRYFNETFVAILLGT
jgi:small ligand-binding sensory domain FIST